MSKALAISGAAELFADVSTANEKAADGPRTDGRFEGAVTLLIIIIFFCDEKVKRDSRVYANISQRLLELIRTLPLTDY